MGLETQATQQSLPLQQRHRDDASVSTRSRGKVLCGDHCSGRAICVTQRMQMKVAPEGMRYDISGVINENVRVEDVPPGKKPCPGAMGPHWTAWHTTGTFHMPCLSCTDRVAKLSPGWQSCLQDSMKLSQPQNLPNNLLIQARQRRQVHVWKD